MITEGFRTNITELQYSHRGLSSNFIAGAGYYRQRKGVDTSFDVRDVGTTDASNAYMYLSLNGWSSDVYIQLGLGYDNVGPEFGFTDKTQRQLNPKFGFVWDITKNATLRASSARALKRRFTTNQTLEPTQLAGFNQFYDDPDGTDAKLNALGFDFKIVPSVFAGFDFRRRNLRVPQDIEFFDWRERIGRAYLYWTPGNVITASTAFEYEKLTRDPLLPGGELFQEVITRTVPISIRYISSRWILKFTTTYVLQHGLFFFPPLGTDATRASDSFFISDLAFTYRLPHRRGIIGLEVRNLFDREFNFQETDVVHPRFARRRQLLLRGVLEF